MHGRMRALMCIVALAVLGGCNQRHDAQAIGKPKDQQRPPAVRESPPETPPDFDGPGPATNPNVHPTGDASRGMEVFRYETFGNEGFWTTAVRLPQGLLAEGLTPLDALRLGLSINSEAVDPVLLKRLQEEAGTDLSMAAAPTLHAPRALRTLLESNAVIGLVVKDSDGDGALDLADGDRLGVSCALCHAVTDGSVMRLEGGGSIGRELDGPTPWALQTGELMALAANSRALHPLLQVSHAALGGRGVGVASESIGPDATEAEVDAWLRSHWRAGTVDLIPDGIGAPTLFQPAFRTDRGAPWGHDGAIRRYDDFVNFVYTIALDPTTLLTASGRQFLGALAGDAGEALAADYASILMETGVTGHPFVRADAVTAPGTPEGFAGLRVEETKLHDLAAYTDRRGALLAPFEPEDAVKRGQAIFQRACTECHRSSAQFFVPPQVVELQRLWPGYAPSPLPLERRAPFDAAVDAPGGYDDRLVLMNASLRGLARGYAMPQLVELHRKPAFLHDGSVPTLEALLDPSRGTSAPHPFYLADPAERQDVIRFLRSLE